MTKIKINFNLDVFKYNILLSDPFIYSSIHYNMSIIYTVIARGDVLLV